ncbi:hypothetical protein LWF01_04300 [Saxibacter everestensis]|uniref:MOSC domain-containing protein n=1 Tax=Saxibacter everestensis TaxID=2909229 RepID=A0ABY8QVL1_9MICO|nr:hypothetical protein LWF01_04300 [Brevibacteriaceae bacterium ZFBP1038]
MPEQFPIVGIQIQRDRMKPGKAPLRRYLPEVRLPVTRIDFDLTGVWHTDEAGTTQLDVHNRNHPRTRDPKGRSAITFMGTGDYEKIRAEYGTHIFDQVAGETLLVDAPAGLANREIPAEVTLRTAGGDVRLSSVRVAKPCVEFSRYCLREEPTSEVSDAVRAALDFLDHGIRGYRSVPTEAGTVSLGDSLVLG